MRGTSRFAFAFFFATGGCAAVFGIPSDVEQETTTRDASGGNDANAPSTTADVFVPTDASSETSIPVGPCDPVGAFGAPVAIALGEDDERKGGVVDARFSDDELTVVYASQLAADQNWSIFEAKRAKRTDAFPRGTLAVVDGQATNDLAPNLSADGNTLTWTRGKTFVTATRNAQGTFSNPTQILTKTGNGDQASDVFVRPNRANEFWFASTTGATEGNDIAFGALVGTFVNAQVVANVNDANKNDNAPVISADGLSLYFAKVRDPDELGKRYFDVYLATRKDLASPFEKSAKLAPLVGAGNTDTLPTWISPDSCRLYMWRFVNEQAGTQAIFMASRPPK